MNGVNIQWGLAGEPNNGLQKAVSGFQAGQQERRQIELDRALKALGPGIDNPEAMSRVYQLDPRLAAGLEDAAYQRSQRAKTAEGEAALSQYLLAGSDAPARDAAYQRLATANAPMAIQVRQQEQAEELKGLETYQKINELGIGLLGTVTDQQSYSAAVERYNGILAKFGMPPAELPAEYSPELIQRLRMSLLSVKDQIDALKPITLSPGAMLVDPVTRKTVAHNPAAPRYMRVVDEDGNDTVIALGGADGAGAPGAGNWGEGFDPVGEIEARYGVKATSGFRTPAHQADLKRRGLTPTAGGAHPRGDGLDFQTPPDMTQQQFAAALMRDYPGSRAEPSNGRAVHITFPGWGGAPDVSNSRGRYGGGGTRTVYKGGKRKSAGKPQGIVRVSSVAEAMRLPSGQKFIDPNGTVRIRP